MIDLEAIARTRQAVLAKYPYRRPLDLAPAESAPFGREVSVLASIHANPLLGADARAAKLDLSPMMLRRILAGLEAKDWVHQVQFSRRTRGYIRYCNLTDKGLEAARLENLGEGTGSFLHRYCQRYFRDVLAREGFDARVEYELEGKRADVGYRANRGHVAVEIGLSSAENEHTNVRKDLAAGFSEVRVWFRESGMLDRVRELTASEAGRDRVRLELITEHLQKQESEAEDL